KKYLETVKEINGGKIPGPPQEVMRSGLDVVIEADLPILWDAFHYLTNDYYWEQERRLDDQAWTPDVGESGTQREKNKVLLFDRPGYGLGAVLPKDLVAIDRAKDTLTFQTVDKDTYEKLRDEIRKSEGKAKTKHTFSFRTHFKQKRSGGDALLGTFEWG